MKTKNFKKKIKFLAPVNTRQLSRNGFLLINFLIDIQLLLEYTLVSFKS